MRPYLEAKAEADAALEASGLDGTIVRPGPLTNDAGTGTVSAGADVGRRGRSRATTSRRSSWPRSTTRGTIGKTFVVVGGDTPIATALSQL